MTYIILDSVKGNNSYLLYTISIIAIFFGIYIIISKNPVVSILFLIGLFFSISMYLINIGLGFLGLVYLIVYVGAVSILFLFILMLINVRISELSNDNNNSVVLAILTIISFIAIVGSVLPISSNYAILKIEGLSLITIIDYLVPNFAIKDDFTPDVSALNIYEDIKCTTKNYVSSKMWDGIIYVTPHITSIGNILYTNLFVLFVITSLILLLAMVGAIIITISKSKQKVDYNINNNIA